MTNFSCLIPTICTLELTGFYLNTAQLLRITWVRGEPSCPDVARTYSLYSISLLGQAEAGSPSHVAVMADYTTISVPRRTKEKMNEYMQEEWGTEAPYRFLIESLISEVQKESKDE